MGAYLYKSKPSHVAKARVKLPDGTEAIQEVALFEYAYKPYLWDDGLNARMHFTSGATACEGAWNRAKNTAIMGGGRREVPKYGFNASDGEVQAAPVQPFLTMGEPISMDDYAKRDSAMILEWLELPKGMKEAAS